MNNLNKRLQTNYILSDEHNTLRPTRLKSSFQGACMHFVSSLTENSELGKSQWWQQHFCFCFVLGVCGCKMVRARHFSGRGKIRKSYVIRFDHFVGYRKMPVFLGLGAVPSKSVMDSKFNRLFIANLVSNES